VLGNSRDAIVETAQKEKADVVVVGSRGTASPPRGVACSVSFIDNLSIIIRARHAVAAAVGVCERLRGQALALPCPRCALGGGRRHQAGLDLSVSPIEIGFSF
jgi:DNA-binding transcriptional LysR family regulator